MWVVLLSWRRMTRRKSQRLQAPKESLTETLIVLPREADKESAVFLCSLRVVQSLEGERRHVGCAETEDLKLIEAWRGPGQQPAFRFRRLLKGMFALLPIRQVFAVPFV